MAIYPASPRSDLLTAFNMASFSYVCLRRTFTSCLHMSYGTSPVFTSLPENHGIFGGWLIIIFVTLSSDLDGVDVDLADGIGGGCRSILVSGITSNFPFLVSGVTSNFPFIFRNPSIQSVNSSGVSALGLTPICINVSIIFLISGSTSVGVFGC